MNICVFMRDLDAAAREQSECRCVAADAIESAKACSGRLLSYGADLWHSEVT